MVWQGLGVVQASYPKPSIKRKEGGGSRHRLVSYTSDIFSPQSEWNPRGHMDTKVEALSLPYLHQRHAFVLELQLLKREQKEM